MNPTPRVALVTGAAQRIGRAIALALAQGGWDVAVHYSTSAEEARQTVSDIQALGRRAVALKADLADAGQTSGLLGQCAGALGEATCVINNAARFDYDDAATLSPGLFHTHMHINLLAPVLLARELHGRMAQYPATMQGVVVNLLDQKLDNYNPDFMSYTLSKAGLAAATVMLAQALAPRLRVVGVAPGISLISGEQSAEGFARAHRRTPLGYSSTPEDVASAVCFAVDARAMTGTTLVIDGGQHLVASPRDVMFLAD
jgi:NAD(P)-dependent dehydrogenase (short-subunit alcohol dehydrogenase family)